MNHFSLEIILFICKNEHSNSIEENRNKNRNIFYSILCILLIQIREC